MAQTRKFRGQVMSGRGLATIELQEVEAELRDIVGEPLYPGSLNIILTRPVRLKMSKASSFDGDARLVWPAALNGENIWIYRWPDAHLHEVEILSGEHLRTRFGLADGDEVVLSVASSLIDRLALFSWLVWSLCWLRRRGRVYTDDLYHARMVPICRNYDATQREPSKSARDLLIAALKAVVKRVPLAARLVRRLKARIVNPVPQPYAYTPRGARECESVADKSLREIQNLIDYTKTSNADYSGQDFPAGYHSLHIHGRRLVGQRDPAKRLALAPVDFRGKSVLDLGCNQGGMLFEIAQAVKWAVGLDYDYRTINAANRIKRELAADKLDFYVFDLEREPLPLIENLLPEPKADLCLLLSVCMWLRNWTEVIDFAASHSDMLLFESNGSPHQQGEQLAYLRKVYGAVQELASTSDDDPGQKLRKFYHCTGAFRTPVLGLG